jgi:hypothetical protein
VLFNRVFRFISVVYGVHSPSSIFTSVLYTPDNRSVADMLSILEVISNTVIDGVAVSYVREYIYALCSTFPTTSVPDTLISYVPSV